MNIYNKISNYKSDKQDILIAGTIFSAFILYIYYRNVVALKLALSLFVDIWVVLMIWKNKVRIFPIIVFGIFYNILFVLISDASPFVSLLYLPISLLLISRNEVKLKWYYILSVCMLLLLLLELNRSYNRYLLFGGISRNYISVFVLFSIALIYIGHEKNNKDCPFYIPIMYLIVCVYSVGRGGIYSAIIFLGLTIIKNMFFETKLSMAGKIRNIVLVLVVMAALFYLVYKNWDYISVTYLNRFLGRDYSISSSDAGRIYMFKEYLNQCSSSLSSFIFGADATKISIDTTNLHNSYLQIHSEFGIIGLLAFVIGVAKAFKHLIINKKYDSIILLVTILFRSSIDWCYPGFIMDIVILYYIVLPIYKKQNSNI